MLGTKKHEPNTAHRRLLFGEGLLQPETEQKRIHRPVGKADGNGRIEVFDFATICFYRDPGIFEHQPHVHVRLI